MIRTISIQSETSLLQHRASKVARQIFAWPFWLNCLQDCVVFDGYSTFFAKRAIKIIDRFGKMNIRFEKIQSCRTNRNDPNFKVRKVRFCRTAWGYHSLLRDCAVSSNNLVPSGFKLSAIDVTAQTTVERILFGPRPCNNFCPESKVPAPTPPQLNASYFSIFVHVVFRVAPHFLVHDSPSNLASPVLSHGSFISSVVNH